MNRYESDRQEFRPRPSRASLFLFGIVSFLFADLVQAFLTWSVETVLAFNSGWREIVILDLPVLAKAASPFYVSPPLDAPWIWSTEIVCGSFLGLSILLVIFWPTRVTLSSRLFVHLLAIVVLAKGVIGRALADSDLFRTSILRTQGASLILALLGIVMIVVTQRRLLVVLQQFWELRRASERAGLVATLQLPGLLLLGAGYWFSDFMGGTIAMGIALVTLFVAQISYSHRTIYERVSGHELTGANVALTILTILGFAGSVWLFGSDHIDLERRAVTWSSARGIEIKTREAIFREQLRDEDGVPDEPLIRWSE